MANDDAETHVSAEGIQGLIREVRDQWVILDDTLTALYGVSTKRPNLQINREEWIPGDFTFRLTNEEWEDLMSQIATVKPGRGGRRNPTLAFSEQGTASQTHQGLSQVEEVFTFEPQSIQATGRIQMKKSRLEGSE